MYQFFRYFVDSLKLCHKLQHKLVQWSVFSEESLSKVHIWLIWCSLHLPLVIKCYSEHTTAREDCRNALFYQQKQLSKVSIMYLYMITGLYYPSLNFGRLHFCILVGTCSPYGKCIAQVPREWRSAVQCLPTVAVYVVHHSAF